MHKFKYLFNRIIHLDYKNMFKVSRKISKKNKLNTFFVLCDMIRCGLIYQAGYYDYQEFEFYNLNKKERLTYLTRGKNNEIVRKFNNKEYFYKFESKLEFNKIFDSFLKRKWLILNNNYKEFDEFFQKNKVIIAKPISSEGGHGVEKIDYNDNSKQVYNQLIKNNQLLVEEVIIQHRDMNKLYSKSVNTLRIFTFYKDNEVYILQVVLKIGNGGVIDNFSSGGMYTFVSDDGIVLAEAIDQMDNIYKVHPISGCQIVGFKVPLYKEALQLAKEVAKFVPEIAYVGWDIAISENGPVIIEGNCFPGVYQLKPSLSDKKEGLIPKYNEIMKIFKK